MGQSFPSLIYLQLLIDQLETLGETLPVFSRPLFSFTKFGVTIRYDVGVPLNAAERQEYREIVAALRVFVRARVDNLP
jgi:hypothetical protein